MAKDIRDIRDEIDSIDDELLQLLQRRCKLSLEIGRLKRKNNKSTLDPYREAAIIKRLTSRIRPPLDSATVERLFSDIFSISRALQAQQKISFLGPQGSYSHQAADTVFSSDSQLIPAKDIESVINEVITGRADLCVVPVENSTEGMVNRTLDMMATSHLFVVREIMLPIRNCLLSKTSMEKITAVYSHPQPLAQCRHWLMDNLPCAQIVETASTSDAAIAAAENDHAAAIASVLCARLYGLAVLAENINDLAENITRFWVLSRTRNRSAGPSKTSIVVTLENTPGSLYKAIGIFAGKGINLTKIESRPSKKNPWEYLFFIDFQGNLEDDNVEAAVAEIASYTRDIIILGSYPEGRIVD